MIYPPEIIGLFYGLVAIFLLFILACSSVLLYRMVFEC